MARPRNCRRVGFIPECNYFKPTGIPLSMLEEAGISLSMISALRHAVP